MVRQDPRFARLGGLKCQNRAFDASETLYRTETRCFSETFCLFLPYLLKAKPYIVPKLGALPKPFVCFSLICSSPNPISCRNSVFFRNLLIVSALFAQAGTLYRAETRCFSETFCLFQPYLLKAKPSFFVELGAVVHQRETSARFRHQRNLQAFFVTFCLFAF